MGQPISPRLRALLLAAIVVLGSAGAVSAAGPAGADTPDPVGWPKPRFLSYNVCGAACAMYQNSSTAWRNKIVAAMDGWDTDVIMFQEMCYGQWALLRDHLGSRSGTRYDTVWAATLASTNGCAKWGPDKRFGLSIFAKGAPATYRNRQVIPLDKAVPSENRALLCGDIPVRGRSVRTCNTHLDPAAQNKEVQASQVGNLARPWAQQYPVVLGGDFNLRPREAPMRHFYNHNGGVGEFQEVDENDKEFFDPACPSTQDRCRSGEVTDDPECSAGPERQKIDYIFLSYRHFTTLRGDAAACTPGMSDHHLLRGATSWE